MDEETKEIISAMLITEIQRVYARTWAIPPEYSLKSWLDGLRKVADLVGFNWDEIVNDQTNDYERYIINELLAGRPIAGM
jgi:hypothetical protein